MLWTLVLNLHHVPICQQMLRFGTISEEARELLPCSEQGLETHLTLPHLQAQGSQPLTQVATSRHCEMGLKQGPWFGETWALVSFML